MPFSLPKDRVYIIAEAGVNHDGSMEKARQLIDVAADAKSDAVKFQLFRADEIISKNAPLAAYQRKAGEENQYQMVRRLELPQEAFRELQSHAEKRGLDFITTPFDVESARFLSDLGVEAIKISSGEITNIPFLKEVASLKIFTIISTGMSSLEEIKEAIAPFIKERTPFALLHCVSAYPAPIDQVNLRSMKTMEEQFNVPIGFSDHTEGTKVSITAAKLGAKIIEKHFTMSRNDPGPDHAASLEPDELKEMIRIIKDEKALQNAALIEEAFGSSEKCCQHCEQDVRSVARRSILVTQDVQKGTTMTNDLIAIQRPGTGMAPAMYNQVLGRVINHNLSAGTPITEDMLL
jgi:N,N'-diacetyllegionaminate synthase